MSSRAPTTRRFSTFSGKASSEKGTATSELGTSATPSMAEASHHKALSGFQSLLKRGWEEINESSVSAILDAARHSESLDDRKMLLEHMLTFMSKTPPGKTQDMMQKYVIKELYNDLEHPPPTWIGPQYAFRSADGGGNNPDFPDLGRAGQPYARSVQQINPLPRYEMPDAGLVFDTLLRRDKFRKHPAGLSSLMFSFAALVIHSIFRTDHKDVNINMTSGYVDLAPLYGNDQAMQDKLRAKEGRGLLHPDVFAEDRLLLLPPACCVLLVLFSRNHNYIAKRLLEINERGSWADPATLQNSPDKLLKQDEEIFQIARLCNCAWFASVVFSDYFSAILGLVRQGSSWSLMPFSEFRESDHSLFERGRGNAVSVEFNCLYRWHATTSQEDEQWIHKQISALFPGVDPDAITPRDFYTTAGKLQAMEPDVEHWHFGDLKRQENGLFRDEDLARVLMDGTSHRAASFGARGTPPCMRLHEIMGIEANRAWGVCSLNEFRKYLGLKTYTTFLEWNPDPEIANAAEKLYNHIDNLELYVGLQAEETKPVTDGAGLCPGYTVARAILADAIALTRGDRFFTTDYTPWNMTAWGFADCQRDPDAYGFGSTLGRLFLRHLPNQYSKDSVYAWFPLMHPEAMEGYLAKLNKSDGYSIQRPIAPPIPAKVENYVEAGEILKDGQKFSAVAVEKAAAVIEGKGFFTASADGTKEQSEFMAALISSPEDTAKIGKYFFNKTVELVQSSSWSLIAQKKRSVNIIADVLKVVPVFWAANEIAGIPLKTSEHHSGAYTPSELFDVLGEIYEFIFLDVEPSNYMVKQERVREHVKTLHGHIKSHLGGAGSRLSISNIFGTIFGSKKKTIRSEFLTRLFELDHSTDEACNTILALLVGTTVELTVAMTNVLNQFLSTEQHASVLDLAQSKDETAMQGLTARVLEALRLDPPFRGVFRIATTDAVVGSLSVKKGERVFVDIAAAGFQEEAFANASSFDHTRSPKEKYLAGDGAFRFVGTELASRMIVETIRGIYSFSSIARGPGQSGQLSRFKTEAYPYLHHAYLDVKQFPSPWPRALVLQYEPVSA
ncbi:putative linoleate diol synthase [Coniophora puteana RWD-64-598 SS2]|uniref:Putative linoleate diol synthase n=1 Tax=Coniophora puteana (strain RWD-64-598) TaxID=741705 RepID=A0A5M3MJR7_CONPW|nr:putative linoleate diol synthase [Coniophora puteana RWD-64-598 SS2]EIW79353.1 putative linoleate diol synthase [Coniophora puteana RWD-64-598 SS2]